MILIFIFDNLNYKFKLKLNTLFISLPLVHINTMKKKKPTYLIGDNLRKFRELKNITRERMASELNLSLSGYGKIERDEVQLTVARIKQISDILEIDSSQLFMDLSKFLEPDFSLTPVPNLNNESVKDRYISFLEKEVERLKKLVGED